MSNPEIIDNNRMIAEFMGLNPVKVFGRYSVSKDHCTSVEDTEEAAMAGFANIAKYHISWDWLMPVVEKIGSKTGCELVTGYEYSYWNKFGENCLKKEFKGYGSGVSEIYEAVVEFLEWYNKQEHE